MPRGSGEIIALQRLAAKILFYILFTRAAEAEAREVQVAVVEPVWLPLVVTQQRPAYFCFPLAFPRR